MLYCIGSPGVSLDLNQSTIPQHQISVQPKENVNFRTKVQRKLGETPQAGMQASGDWRHPWLGNPDADNRAAHCKALSDWKTLGQLGGRGSERSLPSGDPVSVDQ
jgi:hypothetical protein